jgi:hypothetical protein
MSFILDIFGLRSWLSSNERNIALSLPPEVWQDISSRLPLGSHAALRSTCRALKHACVYPTGHYDFGNRPFSGELWAQSWIHDVTRLRMGQQVTERNTHCWLLPPDQVCLL